MLPYELTEEAEQDLREVARYTLNRWGTAMLERYQAGLKEIFNTTAAGSTYKCTFSEIFPDLFVTKYRYHYIFYFAAKRSKPVIIGVIHERRDIVSRLGE